jgi:hypothetical protein
MGVLPAAASCASPHLNHVWNATTSSSLCNGHGFPLFLWGGGAMSLV